MITQMEKKYLNYLKTLWSVDGVIPSSFCKSAATELRVSNSSTTMLCRMGVLNKIEGFANGYRWAGSSPDIRLARRFLKYTGDYNRECLARRRETLSKAPTSVKFKTEPRNEKSKLTTVVNEVSFFFGMYSRKTTTTS